MCTPLKIVTELVLLKIRILATNPNPGRIHRLHAGGGGAAAVYHHGLGRFGSGPGSVLRVEVRIGLGLLFVIAFYRQWLRGVGDAGSVGGVGGLGVYEI